MLLEEIKNKLKSPEYAFLNSNQNLQNNIILLALGGSHAYGMEKETSDLDIRGIALNSKENILLGTDYEQVVDTATDTTIYSFHKMLQLLASNNPNTIEILGCRPENEAYILKSIANAKYDFKTRYYPHDDNDIRLYIDQAVEQGYESEIFMDVTLTHYPLRDWTGMWNEMKSIVNSYNKIGKRNEKAISHDKLGKHMAHLLRLYMMCIDILEKEEIITYREAEHELLMRIRNGEFLDDNRQPTAAFYDLLNEYEKRFEYAKDNTSLPDVPNHKRINEFRMYVDECIIKCEGNEDYLRRPVPRKGDA